MRGLGKFQIAQMRKGDPRVPQLFSMLRTTLDLLEEIALHPHTPVDESPSPARPAAVSAPPTELVRDKLAYSIKEVRSMTGISTAKIYSDIKKKRLRSAKAGGRTLILAKDLQAWIDSWTTR